MQHIDSVFVLSEVVSPMLDQEPNQRKVAMERGKVERSERIFTLRVHVQPISQDLPPLQHSLFLSLFSCRPSFIQLLRVSEWLLHIQDEVDENLASLQLGLVGCEVNRTEAHVVADLHDVKEIFGLGEVIT